MQCINSRLARIFFFSFAPRSVRGGPEPADYAAGRAGCRVRQQRDQASMMTQLNLHSSTETIVLNKTYIFRSYLIRCFDLAGGVICGPLLVVGWIRRACVIRKESPVCPYLVGLAACWLRACLPVRSLRTDSSCDYYVMATEWPTLAQLWRLSRLLPQAPAMYDGRLQVYCTAKCVRTAFRAHSHVLSSARSQRTARGRSGVATRTPGELGKPPDWQATAAESDHWAGVSACLWTPPAPRPCLNEAAWYKP
ncbi:uncharacterized protein V1510DRAFT_289227 [Dipodascopsis tothii]|uniref:uncharacterized protein n=1 Tax=Dipodascopsis tothii TaxID=44089 RepID=UPI0034CD66C1